MKRELFFRLVKQHKRAILKYFLLVMVLPFLEALTVSLVYFLISPEKVVGVIDGIAGKAGRQLVLSHSEVRLVVLGVAVVAIGLWALGRRFRAGQESLILYNTFESEVHAFVVRFLSIPSWAILKEKRDEVANAMVNQASLVALCFFTILTIAFSVASILILGLVSILYAPILTPIAIAIGLATLLINKPNLEALTAMGKMKEESYRETLHQVHQLIRGFERIKLDGLEKAAARRMRGVIRRGRAWGVVKRVKRENVVIVADSFSALSLISLVFFGTFFFRIEASTFVVLLLILSRMRGYFSEVQGGFMQLKEYSPGIQIVTALTARLEGYVAEPVKDTYAPTQIETLSSGFAYDHKPVLEDVSLSIRAGDRVLVRGVSGEGKSTLLKMITGFYPPTTGTVEATHAGGKCPLRFESIRPYLFYCSDDLYIFDGTVREAVDYGGTASDEAIRAALGESCLLDFVESLPQGLGSPTGDDARNFSLGQRQRLLLARLFLRNPTLVILDEATSNLDVDTERTVLENIRRHLEPQSILVVATHRQIDSIGFTKVVTVVEGKVEVSREAVQFAPSPASGV